MASLACCNGAAVVTANVKLGSLKPSSPAPSASSSLACFKRSPFSLSSSAASPRLPCKPLHARAEEGIVDNVQDAVDKAGAQAKNLTQQAQDFLSGASQDVQQGADKASRQAGGLKKDLRNDVDVGGAGDSIKDKVGGIGDALQENLDKAKDAVSDAASSVKGGADKAAGDAKSRIQQ